jgi:methyl-accepting chemotaxis protein
MKNIKLNFRMKLILLTCGFVVVAVSLVGYISYRSAIANMRNIVESDMVPVAQLAYDVAELHHQQDEVDGLRNTLLNTQLGSTGYIYGMNSRGVLVMHPVLENESIYQHDFAKEIISIATHLRPLETGMVYYDWRNPGERRDREKIAVFTYYQPLDLILVAGSYTDEFTDAAASAMARAVALVALISIVLTVVLVSVFANRISRPIIDVRDIALLVAQGDLTRNVAIHTKDEIGELGAAFNRMIADLRATILNVQESSSSVASASAEISTSTEQMAAGAQEQTSQASEVASAVEEMTKTIVENSRNASDTAQSAQHTRRTAEDGYSVVQETIEGMRRIADVVKHSASTVIELGKSSDQIGQIVSVIDDIADQTNLLALNAAIEAARAGEQGRGFAVVADEVRKLAERTTKATKEIADMIKKIQSDTGGAVESMEEGTKKVDEGIELAERAGQSLQGIVAMVQKVNDMVTQIAVASEQQSTASEQISKNVEGISSVTQQTASSTDQVARAAEDLNRLTENLQHLVARFKIDTGDADGRQSPHAPSSGNYQPHEEKSSTMVRANGYVLQSGY